MIETRKFERKPFEVDAVQVTTANIVELADWCNGEVIIEGDVKHIKVKVERVLNERQTKAFVGDWILKAGNGFKVYTARAFRNSFQQISSEVTEHQTNADTAPEPSTTVPVPVPPVQAAATS